MKIKIGLLFLFLFCIYSDGFTITVQAGDNQGLIEAIEMANASGGITDIFIAAGPNGETNFTFDIPYNNTDAALPEIKSHVIIFPAKFNTITFTRSVDATDDFRLFDVQTGGKLTISDLLIEKFFIDGNGGAIRVTGDAKLSAERVDFILNGATGMGGAISLEDNSELFSGNVKFIRNSADNVGGAVSMINNATGKIIFSKFTENNANVFGCDINLSTAGTIEDSDLALELFSVSLKNDCTNKIIENPQGKIRFRECSFAGQGEVIDTTGIVELFNNVFDIGGPAQIKSTTKDSCNTFGIGSIISLGYNIETTDECSLNHATDLVNTDPMTIVEDDIIKLQSGSPAIDSGPVTFLQNNNGFDFLPCGYKDSRGLGRPQDANSDGVFECDRGSYEVQGGLDLTNAQSGLFYDVDRSGEGIILEMLSATSALVTMFTYNPNKTDLMWFIGVGQVVGNSVVIDEMQTTSGGMFGTAFNPNDVVTSVVGGMSLIFPDCNTTNNPGRLTFQTDFEFQNEIENLLVKNNRLTRLLNCDQTQPNLMTGRSGSFYDTSRSGEGIFVQYLNNGSAFVIFYTYTPDGKQFWFLSSDVEINGNTLTANMIYPASTTGYGSQFNPSELDFQPGGTVILEYQPGCNNVNVSYNSSVAGYGSGSYAYTRLTTPAGITCDL
jgi:hypothetical protein